ncbi:alpha-amylase family glycosyl hydrolase [Lentilactobacillus kisonensis]|uniref:alpha-amylase family glycosyl hydrolase n=1 Tax=Lentilactobacillus kisonensis TaxID=481722 RepID=UPI000B18F3DD|nr:alpha-amylase family glycosyl hydrolase [Lentilactobacillus kisonensis]
MNNVPGIDTFLSELSEDFKRDHLMTVGEAGGVPIARAKQWVDSQQGYFNMIFQFDHVSFWEKFTVGKVDVAQLRAALTRWQNGLADNGWNALFLENHDLPRAVSYFGNDTNYREKKFPSSWDDVPLNERHPICLPRPRTWNDERFV